MLWPLFYGLSILTPLEDEDDGNGFFTLYVKPMNLCSGK